MDLSHQIRERIQEHWQASERADAETEHEIYSEGAILDYPQSGERFSGRSRHTDAKDRPPGGPALLRSPDLWRWSDLGIRVHHQL